MGKITDLFQKKQREQEIRQVTEQEKSIDVSIIIPFFNVEQYIGECLDSVIKATEKINSEVILIDDGSDDNSTAIAKRYVKKNESFRYYNQNNKGPGAARNYGVSLAKGKYLLFVDADDYIEPDMIDNLYAANEKNETEMAVCFVCRDKDNRRIDSAIHDKAFIGLTDYITHITKHFAFIYDSTVWNKLILRSFYEENQLSFPEGYLYEDMGIATEMHFYANKVSVVPKIGYHWRVRDNNTPQSITGLGAEERGLNDKIKMMEDLLYRAKAEMKCDELVKALLHKYFLMDFWFVLNNLFLIDEEKANSFVLIIREFMQKHLTDDVLEKLPIVNQQVYSYIENKDIEKIKRIVNYRKTNYDNAPYRTVNGKYEMLLPGDLFTVDTRDASMDIVEMRPNYQVVSSKLTDKGIAIIGYVYKKRVSIKNNGEQKIIAKLINIESGECLDLPSESVLYPELTAQKGHLINHDDYKTYYYSYDAAGFQVSIPKSFSKDLKNMEGVNVIKIEYSSAYDSGDFYLKNISPNARKAIWGYRYSDGTYKGSLSLSTRDTVVLTIDSIVE